MPPFLFVSKKRLPATAEAGLFPSASDKPRVGNLQFVGGYLSPYFVTDPERMEVEFEDAYVLIHDKKISSKKDLLPLLDA